MTVSKAKLASNARYREKQEFIQLRVGSGERERYKALAARLGLSVNQLFIQAVEQYIADNIDELAEPTAADQPEQGREAEPTTAQTVQARKEES